MSRYSDRLQARILDALRVLRRRGPASIREIAEQASMSPAVVKREILALIASGCARSTTGYNGHTAYEFVRMCAMTEEASPEGAQCLPRKDCSVRDETNTVAVAMSTEPRARAYKWTDPEEVVVAHVVAKLHEIGAPDELIGEWTAKVIATRARMLRQAQIAMGLIEASDLDDTGRDHVLDTVEDLLGNASDHDVARAATATVEAIRRTDRELN